MPEISLAKNYSLNEFTSSSAMVLLLAYSTHPSDEKKRNEMDKVMNVELLHYIKYNCFKNEKLNAEKIEGIPEKTEEFWNGLKADLKSYNIDVSAWQPTITPRQFLEQYQSNLHQIAQSSLQLPDDIERFLLNALPPQLVRKERDDTQKARMTAIKIIFRLMQMDNSPSCRGKVSLKKAMKLIESQKDPTGFVNATDIQKAWNHHKKSVHLFLGIVLAIHCCKNNQEIKEICRKKGYILEYLSPVGIGLALAFAKATQEWLLSLKLSPNATPRRLASRKKLWTVPEWCSLPSIKLDKIVASFPPIDAEVIRSLGYK